MKDVLDAEELARHDSQDWSAKLLVQIIQEKGCIREFLQALEESSAEFKRHKKLVQIFRQDDDYEYIMKMDGEFVMINQRLYEHLYATLSYSRFCFSTQSTTFKCPKSDGTSFAGS